VPPKSAQTSAAKIVAGGTERRGVESGRRNVSKRRQVLLGEGARWMPVLSTSCAIVVTRLRALARSTRRWRARSAQYVRATVAGAAEQSAAKIAAGETHPPRRLQIRQARRLEPLAAPQLRVPPRSLPDPGQQRRGARDKAFKEIQKSGRTVCLRLVKQVAFSYSGTFTPGQEISAF
jgi:hypothetical protein